MFLSSLGPEVWGGLFFPPDRSDKGVWSLTKAWRLDVHATWARGVLLVRQPSEQQEGRRTVRRCMSEASNIPPDWGRKSQRVCVFSFFGMWRANPFKLSP